MIGARILAVVGLGLFVTGCPQVLDDHFGASPAKSDSDAAVGGGAGTDGGSGSAGASGSGSSSGSGGTGNIAGDSGGPCSACTKDQECCDGQCVDTSEDPTHCGSCEKGCAGTTCDHGTCTNECVFAFLDCDQNAATGCEADSTSDPDNCGACNAKCAFDQTCSGGKCECPSGTRNCDGLLETGCETISDSDPQNCGACGKTCGANQGCNAGTCECIPGHADCNGDPMDGCEVMLADDPAHCGTCSKDCGSNATCVLGQCGCGAGYLNCDGIPGCESPSNDPTTCGTCAVSCQGATPNCNGTECVTSCPGTQAKCGASCADLSTDPQHCGACDEPVGLNQVCVGGKPTCVTGFGDCDGVEGCEVDLGSDVSNCGACANACKPGSVCTSATCNCAPGTPHDCGTSCRECCGNADCSDPDACTTDTCSPAGVCGHSACAAGTKCCGTLGCFQCCGDADCTGGKVCSGNQCVTPTCNPPQTLCGGVCVNTSTDASNCGGCGVSCGVGRSCNVGQCTPKWTTTTTVNAPSARSRAAHAVLGNSGQLFVWGGANSSGTVLDTGAIYDIATNAWTAVTKDANTPSARLYASAVWTGSKVFVWGGGTAVSGGSSHANGALYDPVVGNWTPVSTVNAPSARRAPYVFWTGNAVLVFAGFSTSGSALGGAYLFDPQTNLWTTLSSTNEPTVALLPTIGWTGTEMYFYGGLESFDESDELRRLMASGGWTQLADGPSKRWGALGGWDGNYFVVWGGRKDSSVYHDGKRFTSGAWTALAGTSLSSRYAVHRDHGWSARISQGNTLFLGGLDLFNVFKNGAVYNSTTNSWALVSNWSSNEDHRYAVGALVGNEFVVWGGINGSSTTATGDRYLP